MSAKNGNGAMNRRLTLLEQAYLSDRQRWQKNEQRWQKTHEVLLAMLQRIQKSDARIEKLETSVDSALRILHRLMEK